MLTKWMPIEDFVDLMKFYANKNGLDPDKSLISEFCVKDIMKFYGDTYEIDSIGSKPTLVTKNDKREHFLEVNKWLNGLL